jgi:hypothetical protein
MLRSPEKALLLAECHFDTMIGGASFATALFLSPPLGAAALSVSDLSRRGRKMGPAATNRRA